MSPYKDARSMQTPEGAEATSALSHQNCFKESKNFMNLISFRDRTIQTGLSWK